MSGTKPPWSANIPLKIRPLKRYDYKLVEAKLDGLLFNVDRDLQRLLNKLTASRRWHESHQLVGINVAVMFTKNSYNSGRYLIADTPEDHHRRPNYVLVLPAINRQLLDLLFTMVYMFDDYDRRALEYERAGWRESKEEYEILLARFGEDPEWNDFFEHRKEILATMARFLGVTNEEQTNLKLIPWWGTPTQLMRKQSKSKAYLDWLYRWLYQDTSRTAHLSSSGIYRIAPFVLAEKIGGYEKEIVDSHAIHIFRFTQLSRLALTVLAIMTEVSTHFRLRNYESISYLWRVFTDIPEGKDMYDERYPSLLNSART